MNKGEIKKTAEKVAEMIKSGKTEIWSAELGNFTAGNMKSIAAELAKLGYSVSLIKNSFDNGFVVR